MWKGLVRPNMQQLLTKKQIRSSRKKQSIKSTSRAKYAVPKSIKLRKQFGFESRKYTKPFYQNKLTTKRKRTASRLSRKVNRKNRCD